MKYLFVIFYTAIRSYPTPCPDSWGSLGTCSVNHGFTTDTVRIEVITTSPEKVNELLKSHPGATVDTLFNFSCNPLSKDK